MDSEDLPLSVAPEGQVLLLKGKQTTLRFTLRRNVAPGDHTFLARFFLAQACADGEVDIADSAHADKGDGFALKATVRIEQTILEVERDIIDFGDLCAVTKTGNWRTQPSGYETRSVTVLNPSSVPVFVKIGVAASEISAVAAVALQPPTRSREERTEQSWKKEVRGWIPAATATGPGTAELSVRISRLRGRAVEGTVLVCAGPSESEVLCLRLTGRLLLPCFSVRPSADEASLTCSEREILNSMQGVGVALPSDACFVAQTSQNGQLEASAKLVYETGEQAAQPVHVTNKSNRRVLVNVGAAGPHTSMKIEAGKSRPLSLGSALRLPEGAPLRFLDLAEKGGKSKESELGLVHAGIFVARELQFPHIAPGQSISAGLAVNNLGSLPLILDLSVLRGSPDGCEFRAATSRLEVPPGEHRQVKVTLKAAKTITSYTCPEEKLALSAEGQPERSILLVGSVENPEVEQQCGDCKAAFSHPSRLEEGKPYPALTTKVTLHNTGFTNAVLRPMPGSSIAFRGADADGSVTLQARSKETFELDVAPEHGLMSMSKQKVQEHWLQVCSEGRPALALDLTSRFLRSL